MCVKMFENINIKSIIIYFVIGFFINFLYAEKQQPPRDWVNTRANPHLSKLPNNNDLVALSYPVGQPQNPSTQNNDQPIHERNTGNTHQDRNQGQPTVNSRRDYVNPSISSTTEWPPLGSKNNQFRVSTVPSPTWVRSGTTHLVTNIDQTNSNQPIKHPAKSNKRDFVNSAFNNQGSSTTPSSALGPRKNHINTASTASSFIVNTPPALSQQQNYRDKQSNNKQMQRPGNSGTRDFVNPALNSQASTTTPWPALGSRKNQVSSSYTSNGPTWVRPTTKGPEKGNVNLGDILKLPSHPVGWDTPIGSTTLKTPSIGPTSDPKSSTPNSDQEDNELRELSETLLKKDVNNAGKYVTINLQGRTSSSSRVDEAPIPLLEIKPEAYTMPTISKLVPLHNNYILSTTESEYATPQEKSEENAFIDAILATSVMQQTRNYLISKNKISKDPKDFRDLLKQIWFNMYSRGSGKISSSGFEHIFLAEIKNNQVSGMHNWIYFNDQEKSKKANYLGYLKKIDFGDKGAIIKYHGTFSNIDKPVSSMFIGTSPELEIALYTTCFLVKPDRLCPLRMDGKDFNIRTYTYRYRGKNMIGSAFPEI